MTHAITSPPTGVPSGDAAATELSSRRTGMSFQRTRLSAERTLMSVLRTSLSLISFGFTIYQFFKQLRSEHVLTRSSAPRNFGAALVYLGVGMLIAGIFAHVSFMRGVRDERAMLADQGLIHADSAYPTSYTLIVAFLLLAVGITALVSLSFSVGPFG